MLWLTRSSELTDWIAQYRSAGEQYDARRMAGRVPDMTVAINSHIIQKLYWSGLPDVADIGCGDGYLLAHLPPVGSRTGVVPSDEEVMALNSFLPNEGISFRRGTTKSLPIETGSIDILVCNGVLLLLSSEDVDRSLTEFRRVLRPNGIAYLGEIPGAAGDLRIAPRRTFQQRMRQTLGMLIRRRQPAKASKPAVDLNLFMADPEGVQAKCVAAGFAPVEHWKLVLPGYPKANRHSYIVRAI